MLKKTVTLSDLKKNINSEFRNLNGEDVIQILHRGQKLKVILTQEYYVKLLENTRPATPLRRPKADPKLLNQLPEDEDDPLDF